MTVIVRAMMNILHFKTGPAVNSNLDKKTKKSARKRNMKSIIPYYWKVNPEYIACRGNYICFVV